MMNPIANQPQPSSSHPLLVLLIPSICTLSFTQFLTKTLVVGYLLRSSAPQPVGRGTCFAAFGLILFQAPVGTTNYSLPFCSPCTWEKPTLPKSFNLTPVCSLIDLLNEHFIYNLTHSASSSLLLPISYLFFIKAPSLHF